MTDTNRPPLWRVMQDAVVAAPAAARSPAGTIAATQIRAVRDWLVPEEEEEPPIVGYKPTRDALVIHAMWKQRQYLRALLTAEADRAERGE